jgi:hypothetical protein
MKMRSRFCTLLLVFLMFGCTEEKKYITQVTGPVDWQGPAVEWTSPMNAEVRGTIGLDVAVHDSSSILRVRLYVDGREDQTLTELPYRFEVITDSLLDGVHLCEARAWDQYENLGISPVLRVNVANSIAQGPRVLWVPDSLATIQSAINAAQDYDTIRVGDGTYYETLNTFGKGIWIESEHGPLRCEINAAGSNSAITVSSSRNSSCVRGFYLTGGDNIIRYENGGQADLYNNLFMSDTASTLIFTFYSGGRIENNLCSGGISCVSIGYHWGSFYNNVVQNAASFGMWNAALLENPLNYGYNLFWNNQSDYGPRFSPRPGDVHGDPLLDLASGRLLPDSPAIDAGNPEILDIDGTRSDIGPFGGQFAYH